MIQASFESHTQEVLAMGVGIKESAIAGLAPPLTDNERNLLAALLQPSSRLSTVIPEDASREDLLSHLEVCCRAAVWTDRTMRKINPVIGRILLVIRESAIDTYKSQGYDKFSDFVAGFVHEKLGYSRSSAYESMRLVEAHPNLPMDKWMTIGADRLSLLAKFTKEGEPSYNKHLAAAEQARTTGDFKRWAYDKGHLEKGEVNRATVVIECTSGQAQQWKDFISDPRAQATAGGSSPEIIFAAMLAECSSFLAPDGHRPPPPAENTGAAFIWRCETCEHSGVVPSEYRGTTMGDLIHYVHDAHRDADEFCAVAVASLTFVKADLDGDGEEAPPIE